MPEQPRARALTVDIETYRSVAAHRVAAILIGAVSAATSYAVVLFSLLGMMSLTSIWDSQIDRGLNVFIVTSDVPGTVPAERCNELLGVVGVRSAGAVLGTRTTSFASSPSLRVTVEHVTPGYVRVAFPQAENLRTAAAGADLAKDLGMVDVGTLREVNATHGFSVSPVPPRPVSRFSGLENSLLLPSVARGFANECFVEAEPAYRDSVERTLSVWFKASQSWTVVPLVSADQVETDVASAVKEFPMRLIAPTLGVFVVILGLAIWWGRRQEFALYRLLGFRPGQILRMLCVEWLSLVLAPASAAALLALASSSPALIEPAFMPYGITWILMFFAALVTGPPIAIFTLFSVKPADVLKGS